MGIFTGPEAITPCDWIVTVLTTTALPWSCRTTIEPFADGKLRKSIGISRAKAKALMTKALLPTLLTSSCISNEPRGSTPSAGSLCKVLAEQRLRTLCISASIRFGSVPVLLTSISTVLLLFNTPLCDYRKTCLAVHSASALNARARKEGGHGICCPKCLAAMAMSRMSITPSPLMS
jgi:hypothetical protein